MTNESILLLDNWRDDWAVVTNSKGGNEDEWNWNRKSRPSFYKVSAINGKRDSLPINFPYSRSAGGKFLIGTDSYISGASDNLFSYNLATSETCNMTRYFSTPNGENKGAGNSYCIQHRGLSIAAWLRNDEGLLVYDKFDIWLIDLSGKKMPINLTNGRSTNTTFRFLQVRFTPTFTKGQKLILSAFDNTTKKNGFYQVSLGSSPGLRLLSMDSYAYDIRATEDSHLASEFLKAQNANIYIVRRESATEARNYFWTSDFQTFNRLTTVCPEKSYNWLTTELITFQTLDNNTEKGVLYKPENFDPRKKYPMIINYYQTMSDRLNQYQPPGPTEHNINIPWFVSNGYLVFTPDIHYVIGAAGQSACNSVQWLLPNIWASFLGSMVLK